MLDKPNLQLSLSKASSLTTTIVINRYCSFNDYCFHYGVEKAVQIAARQTKQNGSTNFKD